MDDLVPSESTRLGESFVACLALVGFLSRVHTDVVDKTRFRWEGLATKCTAEGFLACMNHIVGVVTGTGLQDFVADGAGEGSLWRLLWLDALVELHVGIQEVLPYELPRAKLTRKWPVSCVHPPM